ncbi:MAG: helix-turn-helix domain-containing protein, partial [Proteobacteria bacterium]|nr:helix-turn-helix domain-containing protein [Pseudomonadota bacterium]
HLLRIVISDELDREVRSVADGHTILYRTLINQALHMGNIDESRVKVLTESIWQALGKEQIKNIEKGSYKDNLIIQKLNLLTPVGALRINFKNLKTYKPQASAQDLLLKSFFEKRPNILITRDEVAKELWGEEWEDKYSDWAMDQAIYSLRKIVTEGYNLQTLRNRGYILATN